MSLLAVSRNQLRKLVTKERNMILTDQVPLYEDLQSKFENIGQFGLYLHIPFCRQICPYCPYNKEIFRPDVAEAYVGAVKREIDFYSALLANKPVTSFYIGGGTPTTMLNHGLDRILDYFFRRFNMQCGIHLESHPSDLSPDNLSAIEALNVEYLSVGVEALQDKYLEFLKRPYTAADVKTVIRRAVDRGFKCLNVDFIFALPGQTHSELEAAARELVEMGIDQVAAYPLFYFGYTKLGESSGQSNYNLANILKRRKMLHILENIFSAGKYERTSVWAFTKPDVQKYCSVTVPLYIGLGASGGTYLRDAFYINTFNVAEYIKALEREQLPIALSLDLPETAQMAWWLYWRVYETRFKRSDFGKRFNRDFNQVYRKYFQIFDIMGLIERDDGDEIILSERGIFWLHVLEDLYSLDYVGKLWGTSTTDPWPKKVIL